MGKGSGRGRGKGGFPWADQPEGRIAGCAGACVILLVLLFAMGLGFGLTCANNDAACRPKSNAECSGAACAHKRSDGVTSQLYMYDSASDGWEGNAYTIYRSFDGMRVADGTLKHQRYGTQYLELPAGSYTLQTVGENYPDENSWRLEDLLTGQVYTGKVPTTAALGIGDMTAPCNRGTVSKSAGAAGLPPCEYCTLGKYAPKNASAHGNACLTCPSAFSLRGARAPDDGVEFASGTYITCAVLAGTFLLVWVVLASMNRLVYDNAAADEDKHGFGNRATHAWETTCAGSLSGWFCALLCMIAGLSCLALWAAPLKDTRASMVRDSKQTCGRAAMQPVFAAGLALVGTALAWLVLSW